MVKNLDIIASLYIQSSSTNEEVRVISDFFMVDPNQVTTEDGETYHLLNDTKEYKVSDKPLHLIGYKEEQVEYNGKIYYIYGK